MYLPPKKATVTNIRRKVRLKKAGTVIETRQETGLAPFGSLPVQLQRALHLIEERDIAEEMVLCRS